MMQPMKYLDEYLTDDEVVKLSEQATDERSRVLVLFLFKSLRRISEVVNTLKGEDVSARTNNIYYTILKKVKKCAICHHRIRLIDGVWYCFTDKVWTHQDGHMPSTEPVKVWVREDGETMDLIRNYIIQEKIGADDYVFPIGRRRADQLLKHMAEKAQITFPKHQMHAHMLRHSGAVSIAKKCHNMMQLRQLQTKLQHSSIDMTSYYIDHFKEGDE